jgi:5-bromo-4-chloroindolyl phosphate hydrolysis protein
MGELERTLNELYMLNEQIDDEAVSRRIDRIGELTAGIFRAVIDNPEREQDVRKFMNYYLPTTLKLLKSYDMLEEQSYQGENIAASRKKIENVLDMLIEAYERQLARLDDGLEEEYVWQKRPRLSKR